MGKRPLKFLHGDLKIAAMAILGLLASFVIFASPDGDIKNKPSVKDATTKSDTPQPANPTHVEPNNYGFSANELVWMDTGPRDQQLADMKAMGVGWVRIDMQWYVVQPAGPDTYNWAVYDQAIDAINKHGLRALVILDYAPAWAAVDCKPNSRYKCVPADPKTFATYAAAAAARYTSRGVTSWEIWNEPNSPKYWHPRANAASYAELLKATYPAIKKVNPEATVITGGLRSSTGYGDVSPHGFVESLYAAGAKPYFDALGVHPYSYPALPSAASEKNGWTQMLKIRDIAVSQGDADKKIWITEVGATTGGPHPVTEARQEQIAHETVRLRSSYPWAGPLFWYDYKDLGTKWAAENFFGLVRTDGSRKPAYKGFLEAIRVYK